jgi:hypothetical protein
MMGGYMKITVVFFITIMLFGISIAQVLKVNAEVVYDHLLSEEHQYLQDLNTSIEDYYNNYAWTEDEYETDIDVNIYIIIETVSEKSHERIYKAQFQVKSTSGESFYDKEWEFPYQLGSALEHNKVQFDPLCHFLDFYAALVLAGELDTYGLTLGTPYYDAAQDMANRGVLSRYARGWGNRLKELQKITHSHTRPLREAKPDFFAAVYLLEESKIVEAKKFGLKVLDAVEKVVHEQPNNKYLKMFFDAHHVKFAAIFRQDRNALDRLIQYDNYHRETYREVMP